MTKASEQERPVSKHNPINLIEEFALSEEWSYERSHPNEIWLEIVGRWTDYRLQFFWQEGISTLQVCALLELRVLPETEKKLDQLLLLVNEKIPIGHFELPRETMQPTFRHGHYIHNPRAFTVDYFEILVEQAILESERYFPAFQFVIWGNKSPQEALSATILETVGEA